jgi:hypothetical protein
MAVMTNLLIKDDTATPVETTLVPITDNPEPFWRSSTAGVPFEGQITLRQSVTKQKSGNYKVTLKLEVPVMETLGASGTSAGYVAPPKVAYVTPIIVSMFADKRSTVADRANTYKLMMALLSGANATSGSGANLSNAAAGDLVKNNGSATVALFRDLVLAS